MRNQTTTRPCTALTSTGKRCTRAATGERYCAQHEKSENARWHAAAKKLRAAE